MDGTWTAQSILEKARGFQESQPLLAAAELNLFDAVGTGGRTVREIAGALGSDSRGTEVLLDALAAMGLLIKSDQHYAVPPKLFPLLSSTGESSVLSMIRHSAYCAHHWDRLAEIVRKGRSNPETGLERMQQSNEHYRSFIQAMHVVGREMAEGIVSALGLHRFRRALDVGGASGTYTVAMLRSAPDLRVTLFDLPMVVEMARERLASEGLSDRVDLVEGDFYKDPLPGGHDLVLLSAIIHQNSPSQNRSLYAKCFAAMEPGGTIVIRDFVMNDAHTRPVGGALFSINMLVNTEGGGTYSLSEIRADLGASGFAEVELLREGTGMDALVVARRP